MTGPDVAGSLVPLRPAGDRPPLYCVHPVSGSAYVYGGLTALLDPAQPVYGFEAPGYDDDRTPLGSFDALASEYLGLLGPAAGRSYRLLGWSLGGALAFELARWLVAARAEVPVLVVVDTTAPHREPLPAERDLVHKFLTDLAALGGVSLPGLDRLLADFPPDADPERLLGAVARAELLPGEADADFLAYRYGVFRAHVAAVYDYAPPAGYGGPVTAVWASETPDEDRRWERLVPQIRHHVVPGDHHSMWSGAGLGALALIVQAELDGAGGA
ncbi:MAG: thioesterase domain-containing protein [Mycobacteriales bacterium]